MFISIPSIRMEKQSTIKHTRTELTLASNYNFGKYISPNLRITNLSH